MQTEFNNIWFFYISLIGLIKFIRISSSSALVFFASSEKFQGYKFSLSLLQVRQALVHKIRDKIWEYLDDPMIRTVSFYGGEKWIKDEITDLLTEELKHSPHKVDRLELFGRSSLKKLQHHITTQLNVQRPENQQDAEVNKCLVIFDIVKPELLGKIGILKFKVRSACKMVSFAVSKVNYTLAFIYQPHLVFKIPIHVLNLGYEMKALVESYSSLQLLSDEDGANRVPGKFTTRKTLIGKSVQDVSSNIWEYLLDPIIGTVGLYGKGGVGKTTIIKNICTELSNTDIFNMIIWVSLSKMTMDYDNYMRLQDEVAMQLGIKLLLCDNLHERASRISEKLKIVGKCLFILDDVWGEVSLRKIGIPHPGRANSCKIVLTTRNGHVCKEKMVVDKWINLSPLSDNEAWDLFVSNLGDQILDPEIKSIAQELVYECGGLPIAITTLCHVMKDEVNITAWRLALKDVQSGYSKTYEEGMDHLFDVLIFCIKHLKDDQIRACFLCCAIFPEDHKFDSIELIRYWMAENLVHNEGGILESINEGLEILKKLKDANMLEIFMEGGMEWLKMHDLFRDLAIIILRVEGDFFIKAGVGLTQFEGTWNRKISLIRNQIYCPDLFWDNPCINMSTLLLRDNPLGLVPNSFFLGMPNLHVLDMSYSGLKQLPPSLSELRKLRVLFLDFCTGLEEVPSLERLKYLQFLSLRGTLIKELPQGMEGLVNLKSLNLSETIRLKHIKAGVISSLSNLEELQLQGSRLCKIQSPEVANIFMEISCLKQLGILTVSAVGFGDHLDTILHLQQYNLKSFSLTAYGSTLDYTEDE